MVGESKAFIDDLHDADLDLRLASLEHRRSQLPEQTTLDELEAEVDQAVASGFSTVILRNRVGGSPAGSGPCIEGLVREPPPRWPASLVGTDEQVGLDKGSTQPAHEITTRRTADRQRQPAPRHPHGTSPSELTQQHRQSRPHERPGLAPAESRV